MDAVDIAMKEEVNKIVQELVEMGCTVEVDDSMHVRPVGLCSDSASPS